MKPRNFPARKNQRRITALSNALYNGNNKAMIAQTEKRIINPDEARKVRTKKRRA